MTPLDRAYIRDKGKAGVADLPPERLREVGLLPKTWSLDVIPDPASNSDVEKPLSRELGNALDWNGLMRLAEIHAVRFLHVRVCTNGADPFHMSLWEGVPLHEVIWLTRPKANIRRVYYQSYHPEGLPPFQGHSSRSLDWLWTRWAKRGRWILSQASVPPLGFASSSQALDCVWHSAPSW